MMKDTLRFSYKYNIVIIPKQNMIYHSLSTRTKAKEKKSKH